MRIKSWITYAIYILLFIVLVFLKEYVTGKLEYSYRRSWGANGSYMLLITIPFIFNMVIGLLIGIEHFIKEFNKAGTWKINLSKIVLLGLPSLYFSLTYHIACINNPFIQNKLLRYVTLGTNFIPVFQIVLGNVLITCLYKYCERDMEQH
jgi:hypothetical protein